MNSGIGNSAAMTLLSDPTCQYSHRVRLVIAEKGISVQVDDYSSSTVPAGLVDVNPYNSLPTFVDRDVALYESKVIMEYLDERFPHPPLLPVYPVARAQCRMWMYRLDNEWCKTSERLLATPGDSELASGLRENLLALSDVFKEKDYFMSDDFTLLDCCLAPLLWRMRIMGVAFTQTKQSRPLFDYMSRVFSRPGFQQSLSREEREMMLLG